MECIDHEEHALREHAPTHISTQSRDLRQLRMTSLLGDESVVIFETHVDHRQGRPGGDADRLRLGRRCQIWSVLSDCAPQRGIGES